MTSVVGGGQVEVSSGIEVMDVNMMLGNGHGQMAERFLPQIALLTGNLRFVTVCTFNSGPRFESRRCGVLICGW
jgi:hypothetical protein